MSTKHFCRHCNQFLPSGPMELFALPFQATEARLLHQLVQGDKVSKESLIKSLFGNHYHRLESEGNSLSQVVHRLNWRIPSMGYRIVNHRGFGYQLMKRI